MTRYRALDEVSAQLGRVTLTRLDPAADAPLVHRWVTEPRARFWGMGDHTVDDVREIYTWIEEQPTHHAWLVRCDGAPCALFQTYEPAADPVGDAYPVQPGDLGMHLLIGPDKVEGVARLTMVVGVAVLRHCFADPGVQRLVAEPDAANRPAVARLAASGFELGEVVELPHKRAQLAFLTRLRWAETFGG